MQKIIDLLNDGHNILLTGGAGTGKSYNLRKVLEWADDEELNVARTAMTGMASLQFDLGETVHRCLGIGISKDKFDFDYVVNSYKFKNETLWELKVLDILIIDEISMMRADTLELCDLILKYARDNDSAFGGVQVIFSGDFMQLPPVVKPEEKNCPLLKYGSWAFQSPVWSDLKLKIVYLKEIKRQDDKKFSMALNMIRAGAINDSVDQYFGDTVNNEFSNNIEPVRLLSTNFDVNRVNDKRLSKLKTELEVYEAKINGYNDQLKAKIVRDSPAMEKLELKVGAQVMIIVNGKEYVNGSMGEYLGMIEVMERLVDELVERQYVEVKLFDSGEVVRIPLNEWKIEKRKSDGKTEKLASMIQFPIKLAWAITIHKSQGMSIDYLEVDLARCFSEGMAYVALSRARKYEGLRILNWNRRAIMYNRDAYQFYMGLKERGEI